MRPLMLVQAPVATRSGYGSHSRDIIHSLINLDKWDIKIASLRWGNTSMNVLNEGDEKDKRILDRIVTGPLQRQPDIHIQITVPNEFMKIGKFNLGITAGIETNLCSADWVEGMNRMDMVIVPSQHSKKVFDETTFDKIHNETKQNIGQLKTEIPIEVLFEGVDTDIYKKIDEFPKTLHETLSDIPEDYNFLFVGHWLKGNLGQDRKDTGMLVKTFLETFKDKENAPGLIMKTSGATFSIIDRDEILSKIESIKRLIQYKSHLPNIYVLHGDLTDEEMNALYNHPKVKTHISFTKGEGFGRPLLEASISGKPIIASNWSGHVDFLDKDNCVLLDGKLTQVDGSAVWENVILKESDWFTVNYQQASIKILDVWKNYKKYGSRAKIQGVRAKELFSLKKMEMKFGEILDKYIPEFPTEMKLKLPKLKRGGDSELPKFKLPKLKKITENE